jgi:hypothetical protein
MEKISKLGTNPYMLTFLNHHTCEFSSNIGAPFLLHSNKIISTANNKYQIYGVATAI